MTDACPISGKQVDQNACRLVAAFVVALGGLAIFFKPSVIFLLLTVDFVVRGCGQPDLSPLSRLARFAIRSLGVSPKPTDAAPKMFAARIGSVLSLLAAILLLTGPVVAGAAVGSVLIACASLEALVGVCLGCRMYMLLPRRIAEALAR